MNQRLDYKDLSPQGRLILKTMYQGEDFKFLPLNPDGIQLAKQLDEALVGLKLNAEAFDVEVLIRSHLKELSERHQRDFDAKQLYMHWTEIIAKHNKDLLKAIELMNQTENRTRLTARENRLRESHAAKMNVEKEAFLLLHQMSGSAAASGGDIENIRMLDAVGDASHKIKDIGSGFGIASLVLSGLNLLVIPVTFLTAYLQDKPLPDKTSNAAKWSLSAILFSLTIIGHAIPPLGAAMLITTSAIALVAGVGFLAQHIYKGIKLNREIKKQENLVEGLTNEIKASEHPIVSLRNQLKKELDEKVINFSRVNELNKKLEDTLLKQKINADSLGLALQSLNSLKKEKKASHGTMHTVDRSVSAILGGLALIGAVVAVVFPPVGLGFLAAAAVMGGAYLTGRGIQKFAGWYRSRSKSSVADQKAEVEDKKSEIEHESTLDMAMGLNKNDPKGLLIAREERHTQLQEKPEVKKSEQKNYSEDVKPESSLESSDSESSKFHI